MSLFDRPNTCLRSDVNRAEIQTRQIQTTEWRTLGGQPLSWRTLNWRTIGLTAFWVWIASGFATSHLSAQPPKTAEPPRSAASPGSQDPTAAAATKTQEPLAANSTKKIRVKPGPLATKIGMGVEWQSDVDAARRLSEQTGKPLLWYIPTVPNSFMDRQTEIDRYMMAGPFSWEPTRLALNAHFIPVVAVPTAEQQQQFGLEPFKFVEPGFIVLSPKGEVKRRVDRLTTLHPQWLYELITADVVAADQRAPFTLRPDIQRDYDRFAAGERFEPTTVVDPTQPTDWIYDRWLRGMLAFRQGQHERAKTIWLEIGQQFPDHPFAWKAAAEAEGFGPFVRGFEVYDQLPPSALQAGRESAGSAAPPGIYNETQLRQRSVQFLLGMQRDDGGWVDSDYDFGGTDSLPNVHVAVTALCGIALMDQRDQVPERREQIQTAIDRAATFVSNEDNLNRADRDELFWALAYRIQFLAKLVGEQEAWRPKLQSSVTELENFQSARGGWFHEYPNPFVTGTALCALAEARQAGATVNSEQVDKGIQVLMNDRLDNGAYPYSTGRRRNANRPAGEVEINASAGRMPICELGLHRWGRVNDEQLSASIDQSLDGQKFLQQALKYDDHTSVMAYGGFFFWYGMQGRSAAILAVKDPTKRQELAQRQRQLVLELPELDGCFVDSHELGRCYGTAMALQCLDLARQAEKQ